MCEKESRNLANHRVLNIQEEFLLHNVYDSNGEKCVSASVQQYVKTLADGSSIGTGSSSPTKYSGVLSFLRTKLVITL